PSFSKSQAPTDPSGIAINRKEPISYSPLGGKAVVEGGGTLLDRGRHLRFLASGLLCFNLRETALGQGLEAPGGKGFTRTGKTADSARMRQVANGFAQKTLVFCRLQAKKEISYQVKGKPGAPTSLSGSPCTEDATPARASRAHTLALSSSASCLPVSLWPPL